MKTWTLLLVLLLAGTLLAGNLPMNDAKAKLATQNLLKSLSSENEGVRNSALCNLVQINVEYPELKMTHVAKKVSQVAEKDDSPVVRINASITESIINKELPLQLVNMDTLIPDVFFADIYNNLLTSPQ